MPIVRRDGPPKEVTAPSGRKGWIVPRIWDGGTCYILGGGPSIRNIDVDRLRGQQVIAVNQAYKLGPSWIPVMFFGDCDWLIKHGHGDGLVDFGGLKITLCDKVGDRYGIKYVRRRNTPHGISTSPGVVSWNLNSGGAAINLAYLLGARRIVLLGFDMRKVDDRSHYHDDYRPQSNNPYPRFLRAFPAIRIDLERRNVVCINATPGSALTEFPIVDPEEVLP